MRSTHQPRCILHIGMPKTGSSSIQSTLCKQPLPLDFEYINLMGDGNNSHPICSLFSEQPECYHGNKESGFIAEEILAFNQQHLEKIICIFKTTKARTVIISGEDICHLNERELCRLKDFLMEYCQSIQVIGYVRPFIGYVKSALQQVIKQGVTDFEYPYYRYKFEKFDNIFGKDHVLLVKYDDSTLVDKDVVVDFCQKIGIAINPETVIRENDSLSLEAVSLLYTYHKLGFGYGVGAKAIKENRLLIQSLSSIGRKKISFSSHLTQSILEKYLADIQWMEGRLGCSLIESTADMADSVSSLDDLLILSTQFSDDLKQLLFSQIQQQVATPQKVADWMHLLRVQLFISEVDQVCPIYSPAQVEMLEVVNVELSNALKNIFLSLMEVAPHETVIDLRHKVIPLLQRGMEKIDDKVSIAFSVDGYHDGSLFGWIVNRSNPLRLAIELHTIQGKIGEGVADQFRPDLVNTVSEDGCCAFSIKVDPTINDFGDQIIIRVKDYNKYIYVNTSSITGLSGSM